jgi:resorcinol 4-hydroxylase (FADH2)
MTGLHMPVPDLATLRERAQAIAATARACADQTEQRRRVSAEITAQMRSAGLFRLLQPARYGGYEYASDALIDIVADIGEGCASTAWCYGLAAGHQWLLGCFPDRAQRDVWGEDPDAVACGSYAPVGQVRPTSGGFLVKGTWGFVSNCDNSDWFLAGAMLPLGVPTPGFLLIPMEQLTIEDVWHTIGLAGTGSQNAVIRDEVFVPAHRMLTYFDASSGESPGARANPNPLFRAPFLSVLPIAIGSSALGAARGALKEFIQFIGARTSRGGIGTGGTRILEQQTMQIRVAEASASVDAAALMMRCGIAEVSRLNSEGKAVPNALRIRNRRDQAYSVRLACHAVNTLFEAVGGGGLLLSNGIQRAWRDVNAAAKHFGLNWDAAGTNYGRHAFGLDPGVNF